MTDCLLINPLAMTRNGHAHFIRDWCGGENVVSLIFPPLELAQTASLLRKNGFNVGIIDASTLHLSHHEIVLMVKQQKPDWVGIPSAWATINSDIYLARLIKEILPDTKIVIYGVNVTVEPELALNSSVVDYVILGEPETTFLNIVQARLEENVAYRNNGRIIKKDRVLLDNLDALPFPARDLLPNRYYISPFTKTNPFTFMYTSRGCSYRCIFCPASIWYSHTIRLRSIGNVVLEIKEIVDKYKIRDIIFRDPSFTINREHVVSFCEKILKSGYKINWRCFSHVNDVDEDLLRLMRKAGCYQISYGFETGSQEILERLLKASTIEQAFKAAHLTKKAGIEVSGSFMLGLPGETKKTIDETISFSKKLGLDYAQFQFAIPVPGTHFYEYYINGLCSDITHNRQLWHWEGWEGFIDTDSEFGKLLKSGFRKAYRKFYFDPFYFVSQISKIKNFEQLVLKLKIAILLLVRRLA